MSSSARRRSFCKANDRHAPSCLILDIRLPGISGLDFQRKLAEAGNFIPIIFITGHGDIPMSVRAMKGGAVEFLTKPFRDQDLLDAIHVALERDRVRRQREDEIATLKDRFEWLTPREREVLPLVVSGLPNKQIADEIGTSETTVKVHRGQLMRKMGADSLPELVRMAERIGIRTTKALNVSYYPIVRKYSNLSLSTVNSSSFQFTFFAQDRQNASTAELGC